MPALQGMIVGLASVVVTFMAGVMLYRIFQARVVASWPSTPGKVVVSKVRLGRRKITGADGERELANYPYVTYTYDVQGTKYTHDRLSVIPPVGDHEVEETLRRYPVGASITVYYDPVRPENAIVERGVAGLGKGIVILLTIAAVFIAGPTFGLQRLHDAVMRVFPNADAQVFVLSGGLGLLATLAAIGSMLGARREKSWPSVQGEVLRSGVEAFQSLTAHPGGSSGAGTTMTLYRPDILYRYEVEGRRYESNAIRLGEAVSDSSPKNAEDVVRRYPVGGLVKVRYDPRNPAIGLLETSAVGYIVLWVLALFLFGVAFSVSGYFDKTR
jgi:hypothetical protein